MLLHQKLARESVHIWLSLWPLGDERVCFTLQLNFSFAESQFALCHQRGRDAGMGYDWCGESRAGGGYNYGNHSVGDGGDIIMESQLERDRALAAERERDSAERDEKMIKKQAKIDKRALKEEQERAREEEYMGIHGRGVD